ncbi:hypothetical protein V6N11_043486 [Hibiscus sabdariffa]|uniref:Uncharacterized protein n=1 Tax=Hibiscus sabdariffa TaxID=183260 RepID=A0ABR2RCC4_9ROSI
MFKRASKYGPWLRAEAKGRKKYGSIQQGERIRTGPVTTEAESSKSMVKNNGIRIESPKGKSPIIMPISKEDSVSIKGKSKVINDSDNLISAGKKNGDIKTLSNNSLMKETDYQSDSCKKDNLLNGLVEKDGTIDAEDIIAIDTHICNSLKQIRVSGKRKREEQADDEDNELFSCAKRKALNNAINNVVLCFRVEPCSGFPVFAPLTFMPRTLELLGCFVPRSVLGMLCMLSGYY